jgi:putative DNA primase/helicase
MSETIFEGMGAQHNCDLASMHGKRLAVVHEAESRFKLNAPRIKQLTGGDTIKVKALYKNPIEMVPNFKIVILCNKRPDLDAYDSALKRRIKLIPFEYVVPREKRDASLGEKLKAEASGILNFMIEGAVMHFRGGIREPQAVRVATDSYIADHDSVRSFLNDATSREPKATVGKGELYDAYCQYCNDECMTDITKREFGKILLKMGCQDTRGATERRWKGLRLCSEGGGLETPLSVLPIQVAG